MYVWQQQNWTDFKWNSDLLIEPLSNARKVQGYIIAKGEFLELKDISEFITTEAITTSGIEGEILDKLTVRSSVANRLGLPTAGFPVDTKKTDGLVEILIDATQHFKRNINDERLFSWHAALFPTGYSGINKIDVGKWRVGSAPMEVLSGTMDKKVVHYCAPPSNTVAKEMAIFFNWLNSIKIDGILRAAIAHFWFVTIHPFDDGNGRIARAITDMILAQDERTGKRLYSLSSQIIKEKKEYYNILEEIQKGNGDITNWILWFLRMFIRSIEGSKHIIEQSIIRNKTFLKLSEYKLNKRQLKVLKKLVMTLPDGYIGGITNKKYVSITKTSSETAKRDIKTLVEFKLLKKNDGKGRSTSYRLSEDIYT